MQAKLSILGLSNWDPAILDDFDVPESVDLDTLKTLIFAETAELEVLYSDPHIFKKILKSWSLARLSDWQRIEAALNVKYNPIENYNRSETHSDVYKRELTESGESSSSTDSVDNVKKAAFNSDSLVNTDSTTGSVNGADSRNASYGGGDNREIVINAHGNIGVTMNQTMIRSEINLRTRNLYDIIIDEFTYKFCLGVY